MTSSKIKIRGLFFKRWASLSVKILRYENVIVQSHSEQNRKFLREQIKVIERIKQVEKINFYTNQWKT